MESRLSNKMCLWLGFILSVVCALICGLELSFNVYALPLKETFNYTQTQVEVVASMATMGMVLSFLEPVCTWLFGFKTTCLIIALGVPASSCLFSIAAYYNQFFHSWPSLICLIQLMLGTINCNAFIAFSRVCVELLPKHYTGKLVGLYMAATCGGKIYFGAIMELVVHDDLVTFFLSVAVVSLVLYSTCLAFLYPLATDQDLRDKLEAEDEESGAANNSPTGSSKDMLRSPFFHIMFWCSAINYGGGYTYLNNITSIAQSVGVTNPIVTVFVMSCVITIVRLAFGIIYDRYQSIVCGFTLLYISYCAFIVGLVICLFFLDRPLLLATTVLLGTGMAPGMSMSLTILFTWFGRRHYSAISAAFLGVTGASQILLQVSFGFFYDSEIRRRGETGTVCYGKECFFWSSFIMLIITLTVCVLQMINFATIARRNKT